MLKVYNTKEEVFNDALAFMDKRLLDVMEKDDVAEAKRDIEKHGKKRKGFLGQLVQKYVFNQALVDNRHEADFKIAGVELKTTPIKKHKSKEYAVKERLVFSMIDYVSVVLEDWEHSSFLDKNKLILLMFYLYESDLSLLEYKFKFLYELDLVNKISAEDALQIKNDWEYIINKIKRGEAHLLSEGETFYLGACTKAANSSITRKQPNSDIQAKPRAFSLKQNYLNFILHEKIMGLEGDIQSISEKGKTIDKSVDDRLAPFIGMSDKQILSEIGLKVNKKTKQYKRLLANLMLGISANKVEEFEKSNVTMKVVVLESNGKLKESISFPYFNYKQILKQKWEETNFFKMLEEDRFLFIIFRKDKDKTKDLIHFEGYKFWNFPASDMNYAESVWSKTKKLVDKGKIVKEIKKYKNGKERRFTFFPTSKFNGVAHVRPHGKDSSDVIELPTEDEFTGSKFYTKHCFWLNADYIRKNLEK
ncbi:DNA mismatch repair protein [Patescibacteria group bacterium]|nr:DNA mismatch repair protein [Patescibacteria group bacterium]